MAKRKHAIVVAENQGNTIPYLFSLDKVEKSNCKLCQSKLRDTAEGLYDDQKRKNYSAITRELNEKHNFDISVVAVRNHMIYHHQAIQNNTALQEYAEDVQNWVNMQTDKVSAFKARIAILEREMFTIAQSSEDIDMMERRKNAETVKKLAETILTYENKLDDFREDAKPVNLIFNQLKIIVNDEMQHVENATTRKVLSTVMHRLKDSVGEMIAE